MEPPGNVLAGLSAYRERLFHDMGEPSARAFFDFPVVAWLRGAPDSPTLAAWARALKAPLAFGASMARDGALYLPFTGPLAGECAWLAAMIRDADAPPTAAVPFKAGFGLFCAFMRGAGDEALAGREPLPSGCAAYRLAVVALEWTPGPAMASSWRIRESAPSGRCARGA